jgi:hypothetical protein
MATPKLTPPPGWGNATEFSVYVWPTSPDGQYYRAKANVGPRAAVQAARRLTAHAPARIMITDGGDCCCFEWERGKGVIFPHSGEGDAP